MLFFSLLLVISIALSLQYQVENCSMESVTYSLETPPNELPYNFNDRFTSIELDNTTGARALDGTNYKFYFHPGQGPDTDKFMIYWPGGSFCGADGLPVLASCYAKLNTSSGTSSDEYWEANGTSFNDTEALGMISSIQDFNPLFYQWNKVRILPLDGSNYQGYLEEPLEYNGTKMWIRGYNNTKATLEYLRVHYNLLNASEIILCGGSAGSIAAIVWASYLRDYFPSNIRISLILDGGLFLDAYSHSSHCYLLRFMLQQIIETFQFNKTDLYKNCRYKDTELWKCLMLQHIYKDINIPVYFSNSQNDQAVLSNLYGVSCILDGGPDMCGSKDRAAITHYREKLLKLVLKMRKAKPTWGFWLRSCFEHGNQFIWGWYGHSMDVFSAETLKSDNIPNTLYRWYLGEEEHVTYIDLIDWLHNPKCLYYNE